ncbi:alkaline ceramidase 3-like [Physella acuta]|uniref:alkaline ceramidase 3-like n=1 Tax=Physella acuta TaxID=109671 RepID=UPI0027DC11CD|nr:alkaline ceramidase 3-like [Physella acuta]
MAPTHGYWGKQTSTVDWCEDNYVVSYYIAEFWNTLSNAVIIIAPLFMLIVGWRQKIETRFIYSFFAMTAIGLGSWLFHMTLRYSMQLLDEVPMLWASTCFIYLTLMVKGKPNIENKKLQAALFTMCTIVTLMHILINLPVFFQVVYGVLNVIVIFLLFKIALTMECNKALYMLGFLCYLVGFILWNVDNLYCHKLKSLKVAQTTGMLFECHAWWHIFSGIGAYLGFLFLLHTRYVFLKKKPVIQLVFEFWPYVITDTTENNNKINM